MLDGKALILATKKYAHDNVSKSWYYTLSTLIFLISSLTLTILVPWLLLKFVLSIFSGLLIVRLFVIYHDYLHKAILHKSKIAELFFTIYGWYTLAPKRIWANSHNYHHKHNSKLSTASIGSYPIYTLHQFKNSSKKKQQTYLFIRHPLTIIFGVIFAFLFGMCIRPLLKKGIYQCFDNIIAMLFHVFYQGSVIYFFNIQTWLFICFIPHFISGAIGAYLFYVQHNFPGVLFDTNENWVYEKAAMESTCYMNTTPFWHWVTGNIGYHHIHHMNARIPFYKLPTVMNEIKEFQNVKQTTLKLKDITAALKLKVWDPDIQKMIPV